MSEHHNEYIRKRCFTEEEAADYLGVRASFLKRARFASKKPLYKLPPPPHIKLGMWVRYLREDLDAWLVEFKHSKKTKKTKKRSRVAKTL